MAQGLVALWHVGSSWIRDRPVFPALAGGPSTTESPGKVQRVNSEVCPVTLQRASDRTELHNSS